MRGGDGQIFSNISADPTRFSLLGGRYYFAVVATFGGGNVELDVLGPDNSTWLQMNSQTAAGGAILDLPPGIYRVHIVTATAVYVSLSRVPGD